MKRQRKETRLGGSHFLPWAMILLPKRLAGCAPVHAILLSWHSPARALSLLTYINGSSRPHCFLELHTPPRMKQESNKRSKLEPEDAMILVDPDPSIAERPSPATLLPVEILSIIFWMTIEETMTNSQWDGTTSPAVARQFQQVAALTMRRASQVCSLWRGAALGYKTVWGMLFNPDHDRFEWLQELLRRSGSALLTVQSAYCPGLSHDRFRSSAWTMVLKEWHRFRIFLVSYDGRDDTKPIYEAISSPAPVLEALYIGPQACGPCAEDTHTILDIPLLSDDAPNLRSLSIHRTLIHPALVLSAFKLVLLDISIDEGIPIDDAISATYLLDVLASQPSLELFRVFSHVPAAHTRPLKTRQIHLPHLKMFAFHGFAPVCADLLDSLVLPPTCFAHLHLHHMSFAPGQSHIGGLLRGLTRYLADSWVPDSFAYVPHFSLEENDDDKEQKLLCIGVGYESMKGYPDTPYVSRLILCMSYDVPVSGDVLSVLDCLKNLPMVKASSGHLWLRLALQNMDYTADAAALRGPLVSFFSSFNCVDRLTLSGKGNVRGMTDPLLKHMLDGNKILFPGLKELILESEQPREMVKNPQEFYDYVRWRNQIGKFIPKVELRYNDFEGHPMMCVDDCFRAEGWDAYHDAFC